MLKDFFSEPADVCWKWVLGTWECEVDLENLATFYFFLFFSPGTLSKLFRMLHGGWFVYIINWVSLALSGCVSKGKFDSDFKPSRGRRVFCNHISCSTVAKEHTVCSDVGLNLAHFSTVARYRRRSAQDTRGFVVMLNCRDYDLFFGPSWLFQGYI